MCICMCMYVRAYYLFSVVFGTILLFVFVTLFMCYELTFSQQILLKTFTM